jgi:hypothetical protein
MTETNEDPWAMLDGVPATRVPRSLETRQKSERVRSWAPAAMLPDPDPQDGYVFRWCRAEIRNQSDKGAFQKRIREGWEPVNAEDHPELMMTEGFSNQPKFGTVEIGGLILCKMPAEMNEQRRQHFHALTQGITDSAEQNYMRDSNEVMQKVVQKRRQTVFGR